MGDLLIISVERGIETLQNMKFLLQFNDNYYKIRNFKIGFTIKIRKVNKATIYTKEPLIEICFPKSYAIESLVIFLTQYFENIENI